MILRAGRQGLVLTVTKIILVHFIPKIIGAAGHGSLVNIAPPFESLTQVTQVTCFRQHEKKRTKALLTLVLAVWDDVRTFIAKSNQMSSLYR
jgi:hypothetical protein